MIKQLLLNLFFILGIVLLKPSPLLAAGQSSIPSQDSVKRSPSKVKIAKYQKRRRVEFSKTDLEIVQDLQSDQLYRFSEFKKLKYDQKLKYIQLLTVYRTLLELSRREDYEADPSQYSMRKWLPHSELWVNAFQGVLPKSMAEEVNYIPSPERQESPANSSVHAKKNAQMSFGEWMLSDYPNLTSNLNAFSDQYSQLTTEFSTSMSSMKQHYDQSVATVKDGYNRVAETGKEVLGKVADLVDFSSEGNKSNKNDSARGSCYSKVAGASCLFGGRASKYVEVEIYANKKLVCDPPKGFVNTALCGKYKDSPSYQCPDFGLSLGHGASSDKELCVPLYVKGKIGELTARCMSSLEQILKQLPKEIQQSDYEKEITALKKEIETFQGSQAGTTDMKSYCAEENKANTGIQKTECAAINKMFAIAEEGCGSPAKPNDAKGTEESTQPESQGQSQSQ